MISVMSENIPYIRPSRTKLGKTYTLGFNFNWGITWFDEEKRGVGDIFPISDKMVRDFIWNNPDCGQSIPLNNPRAYSNQGNHQHETDLLRSDNHRDGYRER